VPARRAHRIARVPAWTPTPTIKTAARARRRAAERATAGRVREQSPAFQRADLVCEALFVCTYGDAGDIGGACFISLDESLRGESLRLRVSPPAWPSWGPYRDPTRRRVRASACPTSLPNARRLFGSRASAGPDPRPGGPTPRSAPPGHRRALRGAYTRLSVRRPPSDCPFDRPC
jgi:hypothetical protein